MFVQKRVLGFFILITLCLSLTVIPNGYAEEWDGKRKRKSAERTGMTVQVDTISGSIMEILQSRDNIFLRIGDAENSQWVAIMKTGDGGGVSQLQVGDSVTMQSGVVMNNYHIKGLKRKFDRVVFSPGVQQQTTSPPEPTVPEPTVPEPTWRDRYNRDSGDRDRYNRD